LQWCYGRATCNPPLGLGSCWLCKAPPLWDTWGHFTPILSREISYRGKGTAPYLHSSNNCWLGCHTTIENIFSLVPQPILQLVDDCKCGTNPFPLYINFPTFKYHFTQINSYCKNSDVESVLASTNNTQ
jgi:hypothetical protein